jgi:23S rRNA pseudouridine2605 synthase
VQQEALDALHGGITIDGIRYGSIEARIEREQGANLWLVFAIREGKNREVKNVLGHLGLAVNRLIRISFGPFQLGELAEGAIEEVKTRTLREQLGERVAALAGADFSSPITSVAGCEPAAGEPQEAEPATARGERGPHKSRAAPAAPAPRPRKPARSKRRRDAERLGEPELARRAQGRGRRFVPRDRRGR